MHNTQKSDQHLASVKKLLSELDTMKNKGVSPQERLEYMLEYGSDFMDSFNVQDAFDLEQRAQAKRLKQLDLLDGNLEAHRTQWKDAPVRDDVKEAAIKLLSHLAVFIKNAQGHERKAESESLSTLWSWAPDVSHIWPGLTSVRKPELEQTDAPRDGEEVKELLEKKDELYQEVKGTLEKKDELYQEVKGTLDKEHTSKIKTDFRRPTRVSKSRIAAQEEPPFVREVSTEGKFIGGDGIYNGAFPGIWGRDQEPNGNTFPCQTKVVVDSKDPSKMTIVGDYLGEPFSCTVEGRFGPVNPAPVKQHSRRTTVVEEGKVVSPVKKELESEEEELTDLHLESWTDAIHSALLVDWELSSRDEGIMGTSYGTRWIWKEKRRSRRRSDKDGVELLIQDKVPGNMSKGQIRDPDSPQIVTLAYRTGEKTLHHTATMSKEELESLHLDPTPFIEKLTPVKA